MATSPQPARSHASEQCPECGGRLHDDGRERACRSCGLVVDDAPIDHGPEWRRFDGDPGENPSRVKAADRARDDRGLGSIIGYQHERDRDMKRRSRWHEQASSGRRTDRSRGYATDQIDRIGAALDLPDAYSAQAKQLFRDAQSDGLTVGHNLDALAAAVVYVVCRVNQRGIPPADVSRVARDVSERVVVRRYKWIADELGLAVPPPDIEQRVRVVAGELGYDHDATERAVERLEGVPSGVVSRGSPSTLAATLCYLAGGGRSGDVTQAACADAAGVTPTSVRNRLRQMDE